MHAWGARVCRCTRCRQQASRARGILQVAGLLTACIAFAVACTPQRTKGTVPRDVAQGVANRMRQLSAKLERQAGHFGGPGTTEPGAHDGRAAGCSPSKAGQDGSAHRPGVDVSDQHTHNAGAEQQGTLWLHDAGSVGRAGEALHFERANNIGKLVQEPHSLSLPPELPGPATPPHDKVEGAPSASADAPPTSPGRFRATYTF